MKKWTLLASMVFTTLMAGAQTQKTENLIIVTLDGFRWQELFQGADSAILFNKQYSPDTAVQQMFGLSDAQTRRIRLMPFVWDVIGTKGQLYGNRNYGNFVNCANPYWFSYPGYSELLTGFVDRRMHSNDTILNPNYSFLEFINRLPSYQGQIAAFSAWHTIPYIMRARQAGIPFYTPEKVPGMMSTTIEIPDSVGKDALTFQHAFEYLKKQRPRILYISLDDTDAHAHGGRYSEYLRAAHQADAYLSTLWQWLQQQGQYRDKTTLLITTDHGRGKGPKHAWKGHGRLAFGSGQTWMAVLGPDTPARGEMKDNSQIFQKQFAKTAAAFLGVDYYNTEPVGEVIKSMYFVPGVSAR